MKFTHKHFEDKYCNSYINTYTAAEVANDRLDKIIHEARQIILELHENLLDEYGTDHWPNVKEWLEKYGDK